MLQLCPPGCWSACWLLSAIMLQAGMLPWQAVALQAAMCCPAGRPSEVSPAQQDVHVHGLLRCSSLPPLQQPFSQCFWRCLLPSNQLCMQHD